MKGCIVSAETDVGGGYDEKNCGSPYKPVT